MTDTPDTPARRDQLAADIVAEGGVWTSDRAARANASHGYGPNRNTGRLDLRALARRGLIAPVPGPGNRTYTASKDASCPSPSAAAA